MSGFHEFREISSSNSGIAFVQASTVYVVIGLLSKQLETQGFQAKKMEKSGLLSCCPLSNTNTTRFLAKQVE